MQKLDIVKEILTLITMLNNSDAADIRCRKTTCHLVDLLQTLLKKEPTQDFEGNFIIDVKGKT